MTKAFECRALKPVLLLAGIALALAAVEHRVPQRLAAQQRPPTRQKRTGGLGPTTASIQTHRNLGKAYYEQGKYDLAIKEFQAVTASRRAVALDHLDLGQALMQANHLNEALGELTTARQMDPKLPSVGYNLGILYKRELHYPEAEEELRKVVTADPGDPAAWFNLGTVYFSERKLDEALDAHQHVVGMGFARGQNFYVASLFHCFTICTRLKRPDEAKKYLALNQKFRDKVPNISLQYPALEAGKYGVVQIARPAPERPLPRPERIAFADVSARLGVKLPVSNGLPESGEGVIAIKVGAPSVAVGDYDGDGHSDLYVVLPAGEDRLLHSNGDGTFTDVTAKAGLAGRHGSVAAAFADYDNSGHPSLFVAGVHGVTLYHNNGDGTFTDVTEKAGLASRGGARSGEVDTGVLLFDADDDGFLDLVVTEYADLGKPETHGKARFPEDFGGGGCRLYHNNADGTFHDITADSGLAPVKGRMRGALFADFDNDGYTDLVFFRENGSPLLFLNRGEDKFTDATAQAGPALTESRALSGQAADFDHDGNFDLALWSRSGGQVLLNRGSARFEPVPSLPAVAPPAEPSGFRGLVADLDEDGFADLLVFDGAGAARALLNRGGRFVEAPMPIFHSAEPPAWLASAWLGAAGKLDLVGVRRNGELAAFEKEGPPGHWVEVGLDGYKSNKRGVGVIVELKAGNFYQKLLSTGGPVRAFIDGLARLDVVRVTWPNQVVQNSVDVPADKSIEVKESERLASSCPFLYVWNGSRYVFLTDIMGVAPIGELAPDGTRVRPNPDQLVRLGSAPREQNGKFVFQITDEMREADYFDQLRLLAVDHPAGDDVYANEIYSSAPTPPQLFAVRDQRTPLSATDDHGADVLDLIRSVDGRYPSDFRRSPILGLADTHSLTLDLGPLPGASHAALYLTGWVFWTDSNASRALSTGSRIEMVSPYLQVRDKNGRWVTVIQDMGLPAGTNRTMRVDLTGKFLSADHHVRIVTNLCVYWDQIFFTTDDTPVPIAVIPADAGITTIELPLLSADLHHRGFSTPTSDPEHVKPDWFDYAKLMESAPWNPLGGRYTRYGPVESLLARPDDRLVVMAVGDEMTVAFDAHALPPVAPGMERDFFLYMRGYAKDGEPNTAHFRTSTPLPFYRMSNYPYGPGEQPADPGYSNYLREFETRPAYQLIPPLAPPAAKAP